ncbi:MAG: FAD-dependent oxidoreductase [Granulicella sp.]
MLNTITNYDGSITTHPQIVIFPQDVEQIQAVLRDVSIYPGPVRAKGSYHSLTPCASTEGTMLDMSQMREVISIDTTNNIFTAEAGLQIIDASKALRQQNLQFMTNIEIGNMTLGAASCCHSKDALDGIEFGQMNSYVTAIKWVTPAGNLAEASEAESPELLRMFRGSHGLAGVVYEVSFRVKPVEAIHFSYDPHSVDDLTEEFVDNLLDTSEGLICWTVQRTCIFQQRKRVNDPNILSGLEADARRRLWNYQGAHSGHLIDELLKRPLLRHAIQNLHFDVTNFLYSILHVTGGITLLAPDKIIDYSKTPDSARYAFTFWAFPRSQWLATLRAYLDFADQHFKATGFRCNMPLGAYHIRMDKHSILSYTHDEEIFSIDPIHASTDDAAWSYFLQQFNDFAAQRKGIPLLNQSPFVTRQQVEGAYGQRWTEFSQWVRTMDATGRMLNPFFAGLLEPL